MADFWAGFGQGFSKQAGKSWERAANKRDRREELEALQKYQEGLYDRREKEKEAKAEIPLRAALALSAEKEYNLLKGTPRKVEWDEVSRRPVDQGGTPSPLFEGEETALERNITKEKSIKDVLKEMKLGELTAYTKATAAAKAAHIKREDDRKTAYYEYRGAGGKLADKSLHDAGMWRELSYKRKYEDKREVEAIERDTEALNLYAANMAVLGEEDTEEMGKIQGKVDGILNNYDGLIGQGLKRSYEAAMTKPLTDIKKASLVERSKKEAEKAAEELDSGVLINIIKANQDEIPSEFDTKTSPTLLSSYIKDRPWFKPETLSSAEKSSKLIKELRDEWRELRDDDDSDPVDIKKAKENLDVVRALSGGHRLTMDEDGGFTATPIGSDTPNFRTIPTATAGGGVHYLFLPKDPENPAHMEEAENAASAVRNSTQIRTFISDLSEQPPPENKGEDDEGTPPPSTDTQEPDSELQEMEKSLMVAKREYAKMYEDMMVSPIKKISGTGGYEKAQALRKRIDDLSASIRKRKQTPKPEMLSPRQQVEAAENFKTALEYGKTLPQEKLGEFIKALRKSVSDKKLDTPEERKLIDDYRSWSRTRK